MPSTRPSEAERRLPALGLINTGLWLFCLAVVLVPLGTVALYGLASGRLGELAQPEVATAAWNSLSSAVLSGALAVADRIVVLDHGRIQQVGRPDELMDQPASGFVAQFLQDAALLHGELRQRWFRACTAGTPTM